MTTLIHRGNDLDPTETVCGKPLGDMMGSPAEMEVEGWTWSDERANCPACLARMVQQVEQAVCPHDGDMNGQGDCQLCGKRIGFRFPTDQELR